MKTIANNTKVVFFPVTLQHVPSDQSLWISLTVSRGLVHRVRDLQKTAKLASLTVASLSNRYRIYTKGIFTTTTMWSIVIAIASTIAIILMQE